MSKRHKERPAADRAPEDGAAQALAALVVRGDHRTARARAREILADAGSSPADRAAAQDTLARTGIEPAAVWTAAIAVAVVLAIAALVYAR